MTFTEPLIYLQIFRLNGNTLKYIHRKKLTDLYSENMLFLILGIIFIFYDLV